MKRLIYKYKILYSLILTFCIVTIFSFSGCTYSFKGANPPEGIKSVFIPTVKDESGFGVPSLGDNFTLTLKNKFIKDNTLEYTEKLKADGMITCSIKSIHDEALVVQAG